MITCLFGQREAIEYIFDPRATKRVVIFCMICLLSLCLSSCSTNLFTGVTFDDTVGGTVGGDFGIMFADHPTLWDSLAATHKFTQPVLTMNGEIGWIWMKENMKNYQMDLDITIPFHSRVAPSVIGGIGWLNGDLTPNAGVGILIIKSYDENFCSMFRIEFRHFFQDIHPINRVSFGLASWGFPLH